MVNIIFKTFITFIAIYGLVHIIRDIIELFFCLKEESQDSLTIVVKVKNAAESLEGVVRSLILKCMTRGFGGYVPDIVIVDMGSSDDTEDVARKLCEEYSFVFYTTIELYEKAKE